MVSDSVGFESTDYTVLKQFDRQIAKLNVRRGSEGHHKVSKDHDGELGGQMWLSSVWSGIRPLHCVRL